MKEITKIFSIYLFIIFIFIVYACTKIEIEEPTPINLGVQSMSTTIKTITQVSNVVTVEFETTVGSKYSVLIVPFGKEEPVKKEGFTATEEVTKKVFDLKQLPKQDYDLIFIDINGKEVKHPIIIK